MLHSLKKGIANALAILTLTAMTPSIAHASGPELSLPQDGSDPVTLQLSAATRAGAAADPADVLQVFVGPADACCDGKAPIAGRYTLRGETLTFSPAFGFDTGQDYVARVRTPLGTEDLVAFRLLSDNAAMPAVVTQIYPSGDVLPENVLRFYIHFSVPMKPNVAFDYITLRDAAGTADDAAFMQFNQELWNEDRTRLTVLVDPGRIKRGVATNLELGPALLAGGTYTLSVDAGWPSADGRSILPEFTKSFEVTDALRTRPDARNWTAIAPCAGTRDPLKVTFDRPFDRHLLPRALQMDSATEGDIRGTVEVENAERTWSFEPTEPWPAGDILLVADPLLEDVAGNNFHDLLDQVAGDRESTNSPTVLDITIQSCAD